MKVYLDDWREEPEGWVRARWPEEVIGLLKTGKVTEISLDHDLGDFFKTGYDVLVWLEEAVNDGFIPPEIHIHTANPVAKIKMEFAVQSIKKIHYKNTGVWL